MLHGAYSAIMQDEDGQILEAHSISAGLDYPGTGPEHAYLRDSGRARYVAVTDDEALATLRRVCELEGIIPALESSHAVTWALRERRRAPTRSTSSACPAAGTRTSRRSYRSSASRGQVGTEASPRRSRRPTGARR